MDETVAEFIKRTILKIPMTEMMTILKAWDFLPENQLQTVNFRQRKESLVQDLVLLCESKRASLRDAALLDIIYTQFHRHQKVWDVFQMSKEPGEDVDLFDMERFKSSFEKILRRALKNVTVSFRDAEENAVWIRIAWGTQYRKPNQYKPVYVVYYSQTPYAFTSFCHLKSNTPLLSQALTVASNHHKIVKMDLRSRYLDSLKAIVFKQYNQLETKFKSDFHGGILAERKEPLRCLIKFSSPHLLEALKSLAPAGIADAPLSPLLTCIPNKGMNYFKIRDK
ncbi:centromere protein N isoform X2 [Leopardus geoffroyi]|uniref:Centromere protein N isoform X2 n=1 Tax=Acinonyx jubatus TaxID=32536 RepID=A0A6J2ARX8_ACIJB|nr:centromere protein N isoform X2 [Acinonyx jubatus]XP_045295783.1 centromere protein N isoform X2 [Leopardus geoffroyi]